MLLRRGNCRKLLHYRNTMVASLGVLRQKILSELVIGSSGEIEASDCVPPQPTQVQDGIDIWCLRKLCYMVKGNR